MKKLAIIMVCMLTIALTACGNQKVNDANVFYYTYSDTYISNVRSSLDKALSDKDISFQDHDGNGNQTTQTEQVQTAVTKGTKALAVNIVNTGSDDAAQGILNLAKKM